MEKEEYQRIHQNEAHHWWYRALHQFALQCLGKVIPRFLKTGPSSIRLLDAGCGTGHFLTRVLTQYPQSSLFGADLSPEAINFASLKSNKTIRLSRGSVCSLPFADNSFDVVTCFDVIYIAEVQDDIQALQEFSRVLTPNGVLLIQVPAFEFLRGQHDQVVHTRHRYRRNELVGSLKKIGFSVPLATYRVTFLFPVIALLRLCQKLAPQHTLESQSDLRPPSPLVNKALGLLMRAENFLLSLTTFPFGVSLFVVASKTNRD